MFDTLFALSHSTTHCRSGFPPTLTRPLGKSDVMGLSRTPSPPDRTTAVLGRFESLPNALIEQRRLTERGISVPSGRTRVFGSGTILGSGLIVSQVGWTRCHPAASPF